MSEYVPETAAAAAVAARGAEHLDDSDPLFASDDFRMYCMKILPCAKRYVHDWVTCPFSHPGEKAKRRDPRYMVYTGIACPSMKKAGVCPRGERCPYAHNVFEYWLHPTRYRTQLCNDGVECRRRVCFFAHTLQELRVPATKPFVPPEVLTALDGVHQATTTEAAVAAEDALRRISDSWKAGGHRADQLLEQANDAAVHSLDAAQIENQVLEHLYGNTPADSVVQQLRTASQDTLANDASLQVRLAGALAALRRSRSSDDGQGALIEMLQNMLGNLQPQEGSSSTNWLSAGYELPERQQQWQRRSSLQLPQVGENQVLQQDNLPASQAHMPQLRPGLMSLMPTNENAKLEPTAAEEYSGWVAEYGHSTQRRSLQQDSRPVPSHGEYPRRRSLQVEDWRAPPNPFARTSHALAALPFGQRPIPLQALRGGRTTSSPYSNLFNGVQSQQQQQQQQQQAEADVMHFSPRWPQQHAMARSSLDSVHPPVGGSNVMMRHSVDLLQPSADVYSQRLSLDASMHRHYGSAEWPHAAAVGAYPPTGRRSAAFSDTDPSAAGGLTSLASASSPFGIDPQPGYAAQLQQGAATDFGQQLAAEFRPDRRHSLQLGPGQPGGGGGGGMTDSLRNLRHSSVPLDRAGSGYSSSPALNAEQLNSIFGQMQLQPDAAVAARSRPSST